MHKMIHFFKIDVFMIKYKPDVFLDNWLVLYNIFKLYLTVSDIMSIEPDIITAVNPFEIQKGFRSIIIFFIYKMIHITSLIVVLIYINITL